MRTKSGERVLGVKTDGDPDFRGPAASKERVPFENNEQNMVAAPPCLIDVTKISTVAGVILVFISFIVRAHILELLEVHTRPGE